MGQIEKLLKAKDIDGLTEMLSETEPETRAEVALALGKLGEEACIPPLMTALGDEEVQVRQAAAQGLGEIGEPAVPALIDSLRGQGGRITPYALWALGEIGSPAAMEALVERATESDLWRIRWSAVESLGDLGGERAIETLIVALGDRDERVGNAAAEALLKIGDAATEPLINALYAREKAIRQQARAMLGKIGSSRAEEALQREKLNFWIPVLLIAVGFVLVAIWLASMFVG